jgi:hypothetical protein
MAFTRRHLIRLVLPFAAALAFVFFPLHAAAQEAGRVFSVLATSDADWKGLGVLDGNSFVPVTPSRQRRSTPHSLSGGSAHVDFVRQTLDPATGKTVHTPAARVAWPTGARRALFVLVPRAGGLDVLACDDGLETFPPESVRVFNATRATFQGLLGRERMSFAPGASAPVRSTAFIPPDENAPDPGMPVGLALATPGGMKTLYAASMSVSPRARVLVVVGPPKVAGSDRVQVRAIHEVPPATPPSAR